MMTRKLLFTITCMVSVFTQILYSAHYNDPYIFSPYESKNQFKVQSVREHLSNNIRFNEITFDPWDELYHSQQSSPDPLLEDLKSISKTIAKSIGKASKEVACAPLTLAESIAKTIEYIDDLFEAKTVIKPAAFHQTTTAHADYTKSLAPTAAFSQKKETSYDQVHFTLYQTELSSYLNEIDEHSFPAMHERTQKRIDTFNEYEHNQTSYRESYSLSQEITPYMQRHSLNIEAYEICNGNVIQHRLHQEIIEILTTSCEIERIFAGHQQTPLFGDLVAEGADLAREVNKQGNVIDGFRIADYCGWLNEAEYPRLAKLIKQAAGIVVGAAEGGANIVKNTYQMFRHPWDTTKGVIFVGGQLGKFLMHAMGELEHVAQHVSFDGTPEDGFFIPPNRIDLEDIPETYELQNHYFIQDIKTLEEYYNQTMAELTQLPPEEQMRKITALCFELYFTGKFMGQLGNIKRATTAHIIKPGITSLANRLQLYHYEAISKTCTRMATTCKAVKNFTRRNINHWHGSENFEWVMDEFGNWKEVITVEAGPSIEVAISNGTALVPMGEIYSVPSASKQSIADVCKVMARDLTIEQIEAAQYLKNQIIKNTANLLPGATGQALIAATPSYIPLSAEIDYLRSLFNKAREDWRNPVPSNKSMEKRYLKIQYEHILDADPNNKLSGLHHDYLGYYENNGILQLEEKVIGEFGEYGGKSTWNGIRTKAKIKTFFPQHWTRKEVIENILEAYDNFLASKIEPILEKNGKYRINSPTKSGMMIEMFIDQNCNLLSAYPII